MAVRRLFNMIQAIDRNAQAARNDEQNFIRAEQQTNLAFMEQGVVQSTQQSTVTVTFQGSVVTADLATDEPLVPGQSVWIMQADNKSIVVLGSVK